VDSFSADVSEPLDSASGCPGNGDGVGACNWNEGSDSDRPDNDEEWGVEEHKGPDGPTGHPSDPPALEPGSMAPFSALGDVSDKALRFSSNPRRWIAIAVGLHRMPTAGDLISEFGPIVVGEIRRVSAIMASRGNSDSLMVSFGIFHAQDVYRGASGPREDAVVAAFLSRPWLLLELLQVPAFWKRAHLRVCTRESVTPLSCIEIDVSSHSATLVFLLLRPSPAISPPPPWSSLGRALPELLPELVVGSATDRKGVRRRGCARCSFRWSTAGDPGALPSTAAWPRVPVSGWPGSQLWLRSRGCFASG
jgi:hypothetical protein